MSEIKVAIYVTFYSIDKSAVEEYIKDSFDYDDIVIDDIEWLDDDCTCSPGV